MSWLCWPQDLHIYMVSLYQEPGGGGLQTCRQWLLGLPEHAGQQLPGKVTRLLRVVAAGAPVVCVVHKTMLAQPPLLWPWQQGLANTMSA